MDRDDRPYLGLAVYAKDGKTLESIGSHKYRSIAEAEAAIPQAHRNRATYRYLPFRPIVAIVGQYTEGALPVYKYLENPDEQRKHINEAASNP